jgi:hypothetical protein
MQENYYFDGAAQAPDKHMHSGLGGVRGQIPVVRSRRAADLARRPGEERDGVKRQSVTNRHRRCLYGGQKRADVYADLYKCLIINDNRFYFICIV